jgi:phospholipid N-methyltransferase
VEIVETTAMHDAFTRISSDLIENATIVDNEVEILVDALPLQKVPLMFQLKRLTKIVTSLQIGHCLLRFLLGAFLSVLTKLNLFAQLSVVCYTHLEVKRMVLKR